MEPLVYVLAILGCADGGQLCEPVGVTPMRFENRGACLAYVERTIGGIGGYTDLPYPVVTGRCDAEGLQTATRAKRGEG